jgi:hypothetical protein
MGSGWSSRGSIFRAFEEVVIASMVTGFVGADDHMVAQNKKYFSFFK